MVVPPVVRVEGEPDDRRLVFEEHVNPDVQILAARIVGNYALHIEWSDGHSTGIYSFDFLRRTCPCPACAGLAA